jgi:hypothetical protein
VTLLVHELGKSQQARRRGVEHRHLGGVDERGKGVEDVARAHREHVMLEPECRRSRSRRPGLVADVPRQSDRERGDGAVALLSGEAEDGDRVEAAGEVSDHRSVASQPDRGSAAGHGLELVHEHGRVGLEPLLAGVGEVEVPVARELGAAVADAEVRTGRNRSHALEDRLRR